MQAYYGLCMEDTKKPLEHIICSGLEVHVGPTLKHVIVACGIQENTVIQLDTLVCSSWPEGCDEATQHGTECDNKLMIVPTLSCYNYAL